MNHAQFLVIEVKHIEVLQGGRKETECVEVGGNGLGSVEEVDEPVDEFFFVAGFRDAEVFNGDEAAFLRHDEADEVEEAFGAENIRAGGDDNGAIAWWRENNRRGSWRRR